jgi:PBP1b-binding outer membrane lipoprotein LpoB
MKKIVGLILISILWTGCNTEEKHFEYGSNMKNVFQSWQSITEL